MRNIKNNHNHLQKPLFFKKIYKLTKSVLRKTKSPTFYENFIQKHINALIYIIGSSKICF
jgi:hypothetical protein